MYAHVVFQSCSMSACHYRLVLLDVQTIKVSLDGRQSLHTRGTIN